MGTGDREVVMARIAAADVAPSSATRTEDVPQSRPREETLDQFVDYAAEYRAKVVRITKRQLASKLRQLAGEGAVVVPDDLPGHWLSEFPQVLRVAGLTIAELDQCDSVITGCAVAVAETGSIVLDAGFAQGPRRISLIPDHHLVVVFANQVVESVPEAVLVLEEAVTEGRPLTWISGPSATSDIELSRVEGVHGPRRLDILLVEN